MDARTKKGWKPLNIWASPQLVAQLDAARGDCPRQKYVHRILEVEMARVAEERDARATAQSIVDRGAGLLS